MREDRECSTKHEKIFFGTVTQMELTFMGFFTQVKRNLKVTKYTGEATSWVDYIKILMMFLSMLPGTTCHTWQMVVGVLSDHLYSSQPRWMVHWMSGIISSNKMIQHSVCRWVSQCAIRNRDLYKSRIGITPKCLSGINSRLAGDFSSNHTFSSKSIHHTVLCPACRLNVMLLPVNCVFQASYQKTCMYYNMESLQNMDVLAFYGYSQGSTHSIPEIMSHAISKLDGV